MEEELISFETAKLAKEKGFNIPTISYYNPKGRSEESEGYMTERLESSNWNDGQGSYPTHAKDVECSAPTQSLLQKWLREVHKINIFISSKTIENKTIFIPHGRTIPDTIKNNLIVDIIQYCTNNTYEEALEIALFEALKLI